VSDEADSASPDGRGRTVRRRLVLALAAAMVAAAAILWIVGRLPGAPLRDGPLDGVDGEAIWAPLQARDSGVLWGSLLLHNPTGQTVTLDAVSFAANPQHLMPSVGPYIWDESRYKLLNTAAVSGYKLPLPADWKLPRQYPVKGYRIAPQDGDTDIEVLYEFPVPEHAGTVDGITVRYRVGAVTYGKTFGVSITVCPPSDPLPCTTKTPVT